MLFSALDKDNAGACVLGYATGSSPARDRMMFLAFGNNN